MKFSLVPGASVVKAKFVFLSMRRATSTSAVWGEFHETAAAVTCTGTESPQRRAFSAFPRNMSAEGAVHRGRPAASPEGATLPQPGAEH